jgi:hypothetical protein
VSQGVGPEFKPQYRKKEKNTKQNTQKTSCLVGRNNFKLTLTLYLVSQKTPDIEPQNTMKSFCMDKTGESSENPGC